MLAKIDGHRRQIADAYGIFKEQSRILSATVAFHGLAVADAVCSGTGLEPIVGAARGGSPPLRAYSSVCSSSIRCCVRKALASR